MMQPIQPDSSQAFMSQTDLASAAGFAPGEFEKINGGAKANHPYNQIMLSAHSGNTQGASEMSQAQTLRSIKIIQKKER